MSDIPMKQWKGWDREDVVAMLRREVSLTGSQKMVAERIGISPSWLSDILTGHRVPAGRVLAHLSLKRVAVYSYVPAEQIARDAQ